MPLNFVRNFLVKSIRFNRSKMLSMLLAICGCGFLWSPLPAFATISQLEEYPGQMLYQSRQTLQDQTGKSWQAIVDCVEYLVQIDLSKPSDCFILW